MSVIELDQSRRFPLFQSQMIMSEKKALSDKEEENVIKNRHLGAISPIFLMVFLTVTAITIVCGAIQIILAESWQKPGIMAQLPQEFLGGHPQLSGHDQHPRYIRPASQAR